MAGADATRHGTADVAPVPLDAPASAPARGPRPPSRRRRTVIAGLAVLGVAAAASWQAGLRPWGGDGATLLWAESFEESQDGTWQERSGVVVASRTNDEVVAQGPDGRRDVLEITFGEGGSRWGVDYRHAFEAMDVESRSDVHLSYDVYLEPGFELIGDGKLAGLAGISEGMDPLDTSAGGEYNEDSFSVRAMWREDGGVVMYLYAAHGNGRDITDPANYGFGITADFVKPDGSTDDVLEPGRWHRIEHHVRLNTPGERDGVYELWIDGHRGVRVDDIEYRTAEHPDLLVNQVMTSFFFGGGEEQFPTRVNVAYTDEWALTDGYRGLD